MIRSWRNAASRKVWEGQEPNQFRGLRFDKAIDLLLSLNVARSLSDLSPLKSIGLHKLKGARADQWAMTVNARWRICFEFEDGDATDVEIVEYAGLGIAVADAHPRLLAAADWRTSLPGGRGAVREVCDLLTGTFGSRGG